MDTETNGVLSHQVAHKYSADAGAEQCASDLDERIESKILIDDAVAD